MNGKVRALEVLIETSPHAARARLDQDETILHFCIKLNQLQSLKLLLKMIDDVEFVNAKDSKGNTILHLAVIGKQKEVMLHSLSGLVLIYFLPIISSNSHFGCLSFDCGIFNEIRVPLTQFGLRALIPICRVPKHKYTNSNFLSNLDTTLRFLYCPDHL